MFFGGGFCGDFLRKLLQNTCFQVGGVEKYEAKLEYTGILGVKIQRNI